jgi:hypothetical protein
MEGEWGEEWVAVLMLPCSYLWDVELELVCFLGWLPRQQQMVEPQGLPLEKMKDASSGLRALHQWY